MFYIYYLLYKHFQNLDSFEIYDNDIEVPTNKKVAVHAYVILISYCNITLLIFKNR